MILADSSIWIDHLRRADSRLGALLQTESIVGHAFVTGEIALGTIATRDRVVAALEELPQLRVAAPSQVSILIENHRLWGCGIGYIDAHLLASVSIAPGTKLWTRDKRLQAQAERLGVSYAGTAAS